MYGFTVMIIGSLVVMGGALAALVCWVVMTRRSSK